MDWLSQARSNSTTSKRRKVNSTSLALDHQVQQMKQICGHEVDENSLRNCLFLSHNNLENAVDRYFSRTLASSTESTLETPASPLRSGVKRRRSSLAPSPTTSTSSTATSLGWMLVAGRLSIKGKCVVAVGDELALVRDSVGSPFVRFGAATDPTRHLGTLEPHVATFLGPLLDEDVVQIEARCQGDQKKLFCYL
jgi:hypothetical protein